MKSQIFKSICVTSLLLLPHTLYAVQLGGSSLGNPGGSDGHDVGAGRGSDREVSSGGLTLIRIHSGSKERLTSGIG